MVHCFWRDVDVVDGLIVSVATRHIVVRLAGGRLSVVPIVLVSVIVFIVVPMARSLATIPLGIIILAVLHLFIINQFILI